MSQEKKSGGLLIALVLLALLIAAAAYFTLSKSSAPTGEAPIAEAPQTLEGTPSTEAPPQPSVPQNNIVVETKTLDMPAAQEKFAAPEADQSPVIGSPEVEAMMTPRTLGSDTAPIKVTEYSSLTCGHCATFHKEDFAKIKAEFIDTGKVQFIFKEFPLNEPAIVASQLIRCMPADKYEGFMSLLFAQQDNWAYKPEFKDILKQNAKLAGFSDEQAEACFANTELKQRIVGDMKAATDKYKIQSTPTFVVNDGAKVIVGHQPMSFFAETFNGLLNGAPAPSAASPQ